MFLCEIGEILKNSFFYRTSLVAASDLSSGQGNQAVIPSSLAPLNIRLSRDEKDD